jgi:hypothetical protein
LLQAVWPVAQLAGVAQTPAKQDWPLAHGLPHEPQLLLSVCVSTQAPLQYDLPFEQVVQCPPQQNMPPEHERPHEPQLVLSDSVLTQALPQRVWPVGHWQTPLTRVEPVGQQLATGRPAGYSPVRQVVPVVQASPQELQFLLSMATQA